MLPIELPLYRFSSSRTVYIYRNDPDIARGRHATIGTILDGTTVATGTQVVANFDRLGIQLTLAGAGVAGATGSYVDGDLNGQTVVIESGTGGSYQVGPKDQAFNRIEANIRDMRASGAILNLNTTSVSTITTSRTAITSIDQAISEVSQTRGDLGAFQNRLAFTIAYT